MCFSLEKKMDFYLVRKKKDKTAAWDNSCTPILHNKIRTLAIKIQQ